MDPGFFPALLRGAAFSLWGVLDAAPEVKVRAPRAALPRRRRTTTTCGAPEPSHAQQYARHLWPCQGCPCPGTAIAYGHLAPL